jgi:hypothetical protein
LVLIFDLTLSGVTGSVSPNEVSLAFLSSLYDSLLPSFPYAHNINVGLDETFDLGSGKSKYG